MRLGAPPGAIASDAYMISDLVDEGDDATSYFGFVRTDGAWYIMRSVDAGTAKTYRYARGASGYAAAWADRASLSYGYFDSVF